MKRQAYIAPVMMVQKIELQSMIAVSGPQSVYSEEKDGISSENDILSRRGSGLWADDEE